LGAFLETFESLWEPLWESLGASGSLWKPLGAFGSLWEALGTIGSLWGQHYLLWAFERLDPRRFGGCSKGFLVSSVYEIGKAAAGISSLRALPAASIWRAGPSPIRRLQRGFPHFGGLSEEMDFCGES
jgi:hypothetical protein